MKFFATTLLFMSSFLALNAQNWTIGAHWIYRQDEFFPDPDDKFRTFTKEKDTLIQNQHCSQIIEKFVRVTNNTIIDVWSTPRYLLQDGQKVSIFEPDLMQFFPLYDFSKTTGDTILTYCIDTKEALKVVVDSVTLSNSGSQPLKVQWVRSVAAGSCFMDGPVYERIGHFAYLFARPGFVDPPPGGGLICFSDSLLSYPMGPNCSITVSSSEPSALADLNVFPNPTADWLFVEQADVAHICVFNLFGTRLKSEMNQQAISLKDLPDGVYWVEIETTSGAVAKKIIQKL